MAERNWQRQYRLSKRLWHYQSIRLDHDDARALRELAKIRSRRSSSCRSASSGVGIWPSLIMVLASCTAVAASMFSPCTASQWARQRPLASWMHQLLRVGDHSTQAQTSPLTVRS